MASNKDQIKNKKQSGPTDCINSPLEKKESE